MEQGASSDVWDSGDALERYVGRWSRLVAGAFLNWLGVTPRARWLDVGCGPGALTETILRDASPSQSLELILPSSTSHLLARG
jgi:ubiquinone/menaquinone biosynthesis C-methylase UbiE